MTKWLLIDFDNTQMNTEHLALPSLISRFNMLYKDKISHELTLDEFKKNFHGQARETLCANLSKHFNIEVEYPLLYESREWRVMQHYQQTKIDMAPNLIETLTQLENEGFKFAFVSNNPIQRGLASMRYATNELGDQLAKFFGTAFFEAGDTQKPKPDVYLRAMEQLSTIPANCFAIEDSVAGVKSAVSAEIKTFGFLGFADNSVEVELKLKEVGVVECFNDWSDLPALLAKY